VSEVVLGDEKGLDHNLPSRISAGKGGGKGKKKKRRETNYFRKEGGGEREEVRREACGRKSEKGEVPELRTKRWADSHEWERERRSSGTTV